jgi:enolase
VLKCQKIKLKNMIIKDIKAREILDSRGNPTVETDVTLENGTLGRASVPSGASTGSNEACELRDGDPKRYGGKGVLKAVNNVNTEIAKKIIGKDASRQTEIDQILIDLDGTENKEKLGANAILATSLAVAKAYANAKKINLYEYINSLSSQKMPISLPLPMCNIINGGKHAENSTDIQEFMIVPTGAKSFSNALQISTEIFHNLKKILNQNGYGTTVGDEGGYAPTVKNGNEEALKLIGEATKKAGYELGNDVVIALDVASSELYENGKYQLKTEGKSFSSGEMIDVYKDLQSRFPIVSIEDGLSENDWDGWKKMTNVLGSNTQLVGDDLLVTNKKFLERAIEEKAGNAILVKVNQIGTLSETIETVDLAHKSGWKTIISHRSGETEDVTIAHIAVGLGSGQIKTGSLSRTDRVAKYNELLRIEENLGKKALFNPKIIKR